MIITLNGEATESRAGTVADLLADVPGLDGLDGVAVAVNGEVVPRREHAAHRLEDGDVVDIVRAVAGG